jgi:DNA (cytosine-5)-methyltransferase 1
VENVKPYYKPLIHPDFSIDRHFFWSNKFLLAENISSKHLMTKTSLGKWKKIHEIENFECRGIDKRQLLRNCVNAKVGKYIFEEINK